MQKKNWDWTRAASKFQKKKRNKNKSFSNPDYLPGSQQVNWAIWLAGVLVWRGLVEFVESSALVILSCSRNNWINILILCLLLLFYSPSSLTLDIVMQIKALNIGKPSYQFHYLIHINLGQWHVDEEEEVKEKSKMVRVPFLPKAISCLDLLTVSVMRFLLCFWTRSSCCCCCLVDWRVIPNNIWSATPFSGVLDNAQCCVCARLVSELQLQNFNSQRSA